MLLLTIKPYTVEIIAFIFVAILLAITIYFFHVNRKSLREIMPPKKKKPFKDPFEEMDGGINPQRQPEQAATGLKQWLSHIKVKKERLPEVARSGPAQQYYASKSYAIDAVKETVWQQQKALKQFLNEIENLKGEENTSLEKENASLQKTISRLEEVVRQKEAELQNAKQETATAQKMAARIDEAYQEFDWLQNKIAGLELQSKRTAELCVELDELKQAYEQQKKDITRKQEKLEQAIAENQRLHHQLCEAEDKLAEANLQRRQLTKKTQLLHDANQDMPSVTDTGKKLHTELRRIGELESMLSTIHEERTQLLKRQGK